MGELSKLTGELGENIVAGFMKLVGWVEPMKPVTVECVYKDLHRSEYATRGRSNHGIDFVVRQKDYLLEPDTQDNIIVSAKNREYKDIQNSTKKYVEELLQAMQCAFEDLEISKSIERTIQKTEWLGVLFTLSPTEDVDYDLISQLKDFRGIESSTFPVFIVDNRRISFILRVVNFANNKYSSRGRVEFYYPDTGFNYTDQKNSGKQLPVQYINSSVLPLKVVTDSEEILLLSIIDNFNDDTFKSDVGRAQTLTRGWGNKIILAYPNYRFREHQSTVQRVLQEYQSSDFSNKVSVISYNRDFHSLEVDD